MPDVRSKDGLPVASDFASAKGTPIVIDTRTGIGYALLNEEVTIIFGGDGTPVDDDDPGPLPSPGGFVEAQGTVPRDKWTITEINNAVPSTRSMFTFPSPYNTRGWRVTIPADTDSQDGVWYNGYAYWPKMNYHVGSSDMLILIGLNVDAGGDGPNIFSLNKTTNVLTRTGALFNAGSSWRNVVPEMWYWSLSNARLLYLVDWHRTASDGDLQRMDVQTGTITNVFDISAKHGNANAIARQCHSSADDKHHVGTVFLGTFTQANTLGAFYYNEETDTYRFYPKEGTYDECHIDKTGQYTIISENFAGRQNRVFDNTTGDLVWTISAASGALGHLDTGYGYMVGVNNQQHTPNSVQTFTFPGTTGPVIHSSYDWDQAIMNHFSHNNAKNGNPHAEQIIYGSNADATSYQNELTCCTLNESGQQLIVCPIMTDITTGGGGGDYERRPKGSVDVTGKYFLWTTNLGGSARLDAFLVEVPTELLVPLVGLDDPHGVHNVKEVYGAIGDGSADDTAAIQAAIDAAVADRVGTIVFPPGTYNHTGLTCTPASSQTHINFMGLGGRGAFGVILNYTGSGGTALTITNNTQYQFENIAIVDAGTGAIGLHLTSLDAGSNHSNFTYTNVRIDGFATGLKIGTTDNKAASDAVFINLECSNATTGILVQGPSTGANFSTLFYFLHPAGNNCDTWFIYNGPSDSNVTVFTFLGPSVGQNDLEFDFQSPCFVTITGGYSENAGAAQYIKSGSDDPTENSAVLTHIEVSGTYAAYPSSPSNFVCQFNQPGHYTVRNSVLATGSIQLGGYDDGASGIRKSQLTVDQATIVSASARIAYRADSKTIWLVKHLASGRTAEEANNCDDDRIYLIRTDGTEYDLWRMNWSQVTLAALNSAGKYTDADATPTVCGTRVLVIANTGATTITNFDDGLDQQEVTLKFSDANTTVQDNANVQLAAGANFVSSADDTLTIVKSGSVWYEKCRSVN